MDFDRRDDRRSGKAKAVLARANELREAFSRASSDSERTQLFREMQKLNLKMHSLMKDDMDDDYKYGDFENDNDLLDAYEDDLIDYYNGEDDPDPDLDSDEFMI